MNTIGQRITDLRESQKLTQDELGTKVGISRASLSHYEKGRRQPDFETVQRIADFFQVSVDYLMGRTHHNELVLDEHVRGFVENLELSDTNILDKYTLTIDGRELTEEEARRFIAFVRAERSLKE